MSLHHKISGPEKNPVVLIHGLFGNLDNLNSLGRVLEATHQVIRVDLRNHGHSFHHDSMTYPEMAGDIITLLDELKLEKVWLVGHSMGGKVAMYLAQHYPDRVVGLVVADIAPVHYQLSRHDHVLEGLDAVTHASPAPKSRKDADAILSQYVPEIGTRQFLLKSFFIKQGKAGWKFHIDALRKNYKTISDWPDPHAVYHGNVLFIKGEDSNYMLEEYKPATKKQFPNAVLRVITKTSHWLHAEKPRLFNRLVIDHVNKFG